VPRRNRITDRVVLFTDASSAPKSVSAEPDTRDASNRLLPPSRRCAGETNKGSEPRTPDTRQYDAASPGTGKSHVAIALGVEAVRAGRSVYFVTLADLVAALAQAEREDGSATRSASSAGPPC
jgi:hypothetical protein